MPLSLCLGICDHRRVAELLPQPFERAMVSVLCDLGQEQEYGVQRTALEERRPADYQDRWHALLDDHRSHLRRVLQNLDRNLHAQVSDVQIRVGDEGHHIDDNLHHCFHGHAASVLLHQVYEGVQALLPEGTAILAQVHGEMAADSSKHACQDWDVHLRNAHSLQRLDCCRSRHLVLDALHEGRQATLQRSLELRQVACACRKLPEALQRAFLHLLINVSGQELSAKHLKHWKHLRKLTAGLLRRRPEWINEGTHRAESLCNRLVVGVVAALQEEGAQQRCQALVHLRRGVALAKMPQAHQCVQPHAGVALLECPHQLVLNLWQVWLEVLWQALGQDAQQRQGSLPSLWCLRPQLLVQLCRALRQHGNQVLRCWPLLWWWHSLNLQDA
mmetsp:Transcript_67273/g.156175  ORF Transcript_67273/g.156175 Transcript_67273/m.156175 type:complete len:388 (-) Transcript_67273:872-2035(-)